jgi:hypothetical protein
MKAALKPPVGLHSGTQYQFPGSQRRLRKIGIWYCVPFMLKDGGDIPEEAVEGLSGHGSPSAGRGERSPEAERI